MLHGSHLYTHCQRMITQQRPMGPRGLSELTQKSPFFSQPITAWKRAAKSHHWRAMGHRGNLGKLEIAPGSESTYSGSYRPTKF